VDVQPYRGPDPHENLAVGVFCGSNPRENFTEIHFADIKFISVKFSWVYSSHGRAHSQNNFRGGRGPMNVHGIDDTYVVVHQSLLPLLLLLLLLLLFLVVTYKRLQATDSVRVDASNCVACVRSTCSPDFRVIR